jgi:hypothetical protein
MSVHENISFSRWYISNTKHTLGPELLGLTLGWGAGGTLGLDLDGAHPEAAGIP